MLWFVSKEECLAYIKRNPIHTLNIINILLTISEYSNSKEDAR